MIANPRMEMEADIRAALRLVIDPELGHNIIDLGMVYDVDVGVDGVVAITMTTTARFCPASAYLKEAVAAAAGAVPGVTEVRVELTYDPPWTPDRMAPEIATRF